MILQKGSSLKFFWVIPSFLCGYFVASFFDLSHLSHWASQSLLMKDPIDSKLKVAEKPADLPKPKFEFYTLLAKSESKLSSTSRPVSKASIEPTSPPPISQVAIAATKPVEKPLVTESKLLKPTLKENEAYWLQLASFKAKNDAERMKVALILKGFDVTVASTSLAQGAWFRVLVGPYQSKSEAEKTQLAIASQEHIKGMVRKWNA